MTPRCRLPFTDGFATEKRSNHSVNFVCQNLRQIKSRMESKYFKQSALLNFNWSSEQAQNLNMRLQELISTELLFKIKTPWINVFAE